MIADTAQTCIDCKLASLPVSWVLLPQSSCGYPRTDTDKQAWTHRHGNMDTQTHRQTVLRHAYDHKLVPLWKILPPIWVTIHGLMPSASNPWPAGQGYMAVHQSSHNSACFIAPSVRHRISPRRRRAGKDAQCAVPHLALPRQKSPKLRAADQLAGCTGRKLINLDLLQNSRHELHHFHETPFPSSPFMGSNQILNMDSSQSLLT